MKIKIGPYTNWVGPYQIAEKILFWMDKYEDDRVHAFGTWLAEDRHGNDSWLTRVCQWIQDRKKRKVQIHIDNYDVWSMDSTLAMIILPMLKKLKTQKQGYGWVDDKDVPEHLRSKHAPPRENEWDWDTLAEQRHEWMLNELIWTFEQLHPDNDWEAQYHSGEHDLQWVELDETSANPITGKQEPLYQMVKGAKDTHRWDKKGWRAHDQRINNGLKLFGKYFRSLWD